MLLSKEILSSRNKISSRYRALRSNVPSIQGQHFRHPTKFLRAMNLARIFFRGIPAQIYSSLRQWTRGPSSEEFGVAIVDRWTLWKSRRPATYFSSTLRSFISRILPIVDTYMLRSEIYRLLLHNYIILPFILSCYLYDFLFFIYCIIAI